MEDQSIHVVSQVGQRQFGFGPRDAHGADEQPEAVLLVGEDMSTRARMDDFFALAWAVAFGIGLPTGLRRWMRLIRMGARQPFFVALRTISAVSPDLAGGVVAHHMLELAAIRRGGRGHGLAPDKAHSAGRC